MNCPNCGTPKAHIRISVDSYAEALFDPTTGTAAPILGVNLYDHREIEWACCGQPVEDDAMLSAARNASLAVPPDHKVEVW